MVFSTFLPFGFSWKRFVQELWRHCCWSPLPSSLLGELSTAKRDSDSFFSTRKVYMVSYRSNNTTGSSLIVLHWQRSFLAISACYKMLTQHYTRDTAGHYAIACNVHSCGYSDIVLGSLSLIACKHLALMQYCSVLARRGFCTIVLHSSSVFIWQSDWTHCWFFHIWEI